MTYSRAVDIKRDLADYLRAPRRVPVSESAAAVTKVYDGENWDYWRPDLTPYMVEPMNTLTSRRHGAVIFAGPSRTGKTAALIDCWVGHSAKFDPGDMGFYFPDGDSAEDYGKANIHRMLEESPQLHELMSARAHDNNIKTVKFRNGMLLRLLYPTSSKLSRITLKSVGFTEYDTFPDSVGNREGSAFVLGRKRVQNAMSSGMAMAESSPKRVMTDPRWIPASPHEAPPTAGGILVLYNSGDRRRWYWRCMDCGGRFEAPAMPEYDDLPNIENAAKTARVCCTRCGSIYSNRTKRELNLGGRWIPEWFVTENPGNLEHVPDAFAPTNDIASFWLKGTAAGFQSWHAIVSNYLDAFRQFQRTGMEEALQTTLNTDQGVPFLPAAMKNTRTVEEVIEAADDVLTARTVPVGGRLILATVDVQVNKFVVQVHAVGVGREAWIIDRFDLTLSDRIGVSGDPEAIDPAGHDEDWQLLAARVLGLTYPLASDDTRRMPVRAMAVDSGGKAGVTERAYAFWRNCRRKSIADRVMLVKGRSETPTGTPRVEKSFPDSRKKKGRKTTSRGDVPIYLLNTLVLKDTLAADLKKKGGAGAIHYGKWLGDAVLFELAAEVRGPKGWAKITKSARNEAWDLLVYMLALCVEIGMESWGENWEMAPAWAGEWSGNPDISAPAKSPIALQKRPENQATADSIMNRSKSLLDRIRSRR